MISIEKKDFYKFIQNRGLEKRENLSSNEINEIIDLYIDRLKYLFYKDNQDSQLDFNLDLFELDLKIDKYQYNSNIEYLFLFLMKRYF